MAPETPRSNAAQPARARRTTGSRMPCRVETCGTVHSRPLPPSPVAAAPIPAERSRQPARLHELRPSVPDACLARAWLVPGTSSTAGSEERGRCGRERRVLGEADERVARPDLVHERGELVGDLR